MRRGSLLLAVAMVAGAFGLVGVPAQASHTTVDWMGQDWEVPHNATPVLDPSSGNLVLTRDPGNAADANLHVNRIRPTNDGTENGESFINDNGTPWVMLSYLDNGLHRGVDLFVQDETLNASVTGGSLFSFGRIASTRFGSPTQSDTVVADGNRGDGTRHTLYFGQRPDGTVDINFDGTWFTSTLAKDNVGSFDFNDVYLRLRGGDDSGGSATFTDFQYGDNHPAEKSDCKKGGFTPGFKNQGDCVSLFAGGK